MHTPKKGITSGTRLETKSVDAWFEVCTLYRSEQFRHMSQAAFLRSTGSGEAFVGSRSEQQSFGKRLKQFDMGQLRLTEHKRLRRIEFGDIEARLVAYISLREKNTRLINAASTG